MHLISSSPMAKLYQRISPDSLPLSNGRRTNSTSNPPNWKTSKEDEDRGEINGSSLIVKSSSTFDGKTLSRFRSPSRISSQEQHHISNGNGNSNGTISAEVVVPNSPPPTIPATATRNHHNHNHHHQNLESSYVGGGDAFLQWGQRKRSRCSRGIGIGIGLTDETSSSSSTTTSTLQFQQSTKLQRRSSSSSSAAVPNSISSSQNANLMMPPPPSLTAANGISTRGGGPIVKSQIKNLSSSPSPVRRNLEDRSTGGSGGFSKSPPAGGGGIGIGIGSGSGSSSSRAVSSRSRIGKKTPFLDKKNPSLVSTRDEKINGCSLQQQQQQKKKISNQEAVNSDVINNNYINNIVSPPQQQGGGCSSSMNDDNNNNNNNHTTTTNDNNNHSTTTTTRPAKMVGGEVNEWPRICIPLSRKEKEEDFLAMKGTKLPHRPKKRPKAVERTLQYCFPGLWLSDLPRGRYEVREKKCPRKPKRRGLKGMESMESDSE